MIKSYKIRIYPNKDQEQVIWKHIGGCRYVYNWMLEYQQKVRKDGGKHLSFYDMNQMQKDLRNSDECGWLKELSFGSLIASCHDLDVAYKKFFSKQNRFPKFKSRKRSRNIYPARSDRFHFVDDKYLKVEKLGNVRYRSDFIFPIGVHEKFCNVRISNEDGKWMISFGIECENQTFDLSDIPMGIDLGIKTLATVAFGDQIYKFDNINKSKKMKRLSEKQVYYQKRMAHKLECAKKKFGRYESSSNYKKYKEKYSKVTRKQSNIRENYIQQITKILADMLPCRVTMETLSVKQMAQNKSVAKCVWNMKLNRFEIVMEYKCLMRGIEFVKADKYFPSSKTCSCCGSIKRDLRLSDRVYECRDCGFVIDRDENAALNLMRYTV